MSMTETISIPAYAKKVGLKRDAIYKQIAENRLPKGVKAIEIAGKKFIKV